MLNMLLIFLADEIDILRGAALASSKKFQLGDSTMSWYLNGDIYLHRVYSDVGNYSVKNNLFSILLNLIVRLDDLLGVGHVNVTSSLTSLHTELSVLAYCIFLLY